MTTNYQRVTQGFEILTKALAPFVVRVLRAAHGEQWWRLGVLQVLYDNQKRDLPTNGDDKILISKLDVARCLRLITIHWPGLFSSKLKREHRTWLNELIDTRNKWAHQGPLDMQDDDAWRALDTMKRLVEPIDTKATEELSRVADSVRNDIKTDKVRSQGKRRNPKTTEPGYSNKNNQTVIRKTDLPGNDHNQKIYVLQCGECLHEYGANGSDIWLRRCPNCQGGAAGLPF